MTGLATYLVTTIVLPAIVSAAMAALIVRSAIGRTPGFAQAAAGTACAVALLWAFMMEVDANAVLRQLPVRIPGDDAPFERWHQVGLVALIVAVTAPATALHSAFVPAGHRRTVGLLAATAAAALLAVAVTFPGDTGTDRALLGVSIALAAAAMAASRPAPAFIGASITALAIGGMAAFGGFVSLGAVSVALALATSGVAIACRTRRVPAVNSMPIDASPVPALVLAVLLGTLAACGHGYRDESAAAWPWRAVMAVPLLAWATGRALRKQVP